MLYIYISITHICAGYMCAYVHVCVCPFLFYAPWLVLGKRGKGPKELQILSGPMVLARTHDSRGQNPCNPLSPDHRIHSPLTLA